ncbi:MAG: hypothetical protein WC505_06760 [Patescibacteria group bacterium]
MTRQAGLEAVIDLSDEISDLADLVADVASAINYNSAKAELFAVMLLDAIAESAQDSQVDTFMGVPNGVPGVPPAPGAPADMMLEAPAPMTDMPGAPPVDMGLGLGGPAEAELGGAPVPAELGDTPGPDDEIVDVDEADVEF